MPESVDLREYIPDSYRDLLDMEANDLRSEIPALARDKLSSRPIDDSTDSSSRAVIPI